MQQGPGHKDGPFRPSSGGSRWDDASKWRGSWLQVACVMAPGSLDHGFRWRGSWLRVVWIMAPGAPSHKREQLRGCAKHPAPGPPAGWRPGRTKAQAPARPQGVQEGAPLPGVPTGMPIFTVCARLRRWFHPC